MLHFSFTCENLRDVEVLAAIDILSAKCAREQRKGCFNCPLWSIGEEDCILHLVKDPEHWSREVHQNAARSN